MVGPLLFGHMYFYLKEHVGGMIRRFADKTKIGDIIYSEQGNGRLNSKFN